MDFTLKWMWKAAGSLSIVGKRAEKCAKPVAKLFYVSFTAEKKWSKSDVHFHCECHAVCTSIKYQQFLVSLVQSSLQLVILKIKSNKAVRLKHIKKTLNHEREEKPVFMMPWKARELISVVHLVNHSTEPIDFFLSRSCLVPVALLADCFITEKIICKLFLSFQFIKYHFITVLLHEERYFTLSSLTKFVFIINIWEEMCLYTCSQHSNVTIKRQEF